MYVRIITRITLSLLFMSSILVVKADDSEGTGPWRRNYKKSTKQVQIGNVVVWEVVPGTAMAVPVNHPIYQTVDCCIMATDSDACNLTTNC